MKNNCFNCVIALDDNQCDLKLVQNFQIDNYDCSRYDFDEFNFLIYDEKKNYTYIVCPNCGFKGNDNLNYIKDGIQTCIICNATLSVTIEGSEGEHILYKTKIVKD